MARKQDSVSEDQEPVLAVEEPRVATAQDLAPALDAVQVEAIQVDVAPQVRQPTKRYWMGTVDGAPRHIFYAAGQDFPQWSEIVEHDNDVNVTNRIRVRGTEGDLTDAQVEAIKSAVKRKVVRSYRDPAGNLTGGHVLNTDVATYVRDERDESVAKYMFMVRLSDRMPHDYRRMTPPTMARPVGR